LNGLNKIKTIKDSFGEMLIMPKERATEKQVSSGENQAIVANIKAVLEKMRPAINSDGGDISFVRFEAGIVYLKLHGACVSCPISFITLKMGIETQLKESVPEVVEVTTVEE